MTRSLLALSLLASASGCGNAESREPVPMALLGIWHREGTSAGMNVQLDAQGYHLHANHCDYAEYGVGSTEGDGVDAAVLSPREGFATWPVRGDVRSVRIRGGGAGIDVTGVQVDGTEFSERWLSGKVCTQCSGGTVSLPEGTPEPCAGTVSYPPYSP